MKVYVRQGMTSDKKKPLGEEAVCLQLRNVIKGLHALDGHCGVRVTAPSTVNFAISALTDLIQEGVPLLGDSSWHG
jgi:hypothetical protein